MREKWLFLLVRGQAIANRAGSNFLENVFSHFRPEKHNFSMLEGYFCSRMVPMDNIEVFAVKRHRDDCRMSFHYHAILNDQFIADRVKWADSLRQVVLFGQPRWMTVASDCSISSAAVSATRMSKPADGREETIISCTPRAHHPTGVFSQVGRGARERVSAKCMSLPRL